FVLDSGVDAVREQLADLLDRGGRVRLLTGDYLGITEPNALQRLLETGEVTGGRLDLGVFESRELSFHPKAYIFHFREPPGGGVAYVGSFNLSAQALGRGVEWNFRVVPSGNREGFRDIIYAFDGLFHHQRTRPVDAAWLRRYRDRRKPPAVTAPVDLEVERPLPPPEPHRVQREALAALAGTRKEGNRAGMVVLATGLGKTCSPPSTAPGSGRSGCCSWPTGRRSCARR
ncbi:MAG: phospholipase D-like domain-containing protein, partial [Spirochaetota bacterium]